MTRKRAVSWVVAAAAVSVALPADLPPLGPDSKRFRGSTPHLNRFCQPFPGCQAPTLFSTATKNVLGLIIDTRDYRFSGSAADLTGYRDGKQALYETNTNDYWLETSWGLVGTSFDIRNRVVPLPGGFDDYYNRDYVQTALTTSGVVFPLDGSFSAEIHVRDGAGRNRFVMLEPTALDLPALVTACQEAFDAVPDTPATWVECSESAGELRIALTQSEVDEATFIRPTGAGSGLDDLGLEGPLEVPGDAMTTPRLVGKPVPGGFPLTLTGGPGSVSIEIRAGDLYPRTRTYSIGHSSDTYATPQELVDELLLPALNQEFNWVEYYDAGPDEIGLQLAAGFVGDYPDNASIRVTAGVDLDVLGLDGPLREDGVITYDKRRTVRGNREDFVALVLSIYLDQRAAEEGIPVTAATTAQLEALVDQELDGVDSILVLFLDQYIVAALPGSRRAGASSSGNFDIEFVSDDASFAFQVQRDAGFMIGPGYTSWQTWAHELGHTLGFIDLYAKSEHQGLDSDNDYVNDWGLMDNDGGAPHTTAWHKFKKQTWLPGGALEDIEPPGAGQTEYHPFTLVPLEYPADDYAGVGSEQWPERQLLRLMISEHHWILIENRQPGVMFSQSLPDDLVGAYPPDPSGEVGGLLVTDTCDINTEFPCLFRPHVIVMNPHGATEARGLAVSETWALDDPQANPGYDGIVVRDMGAVAGPAGLPEARQVEIEWGPGDFLELEIRPWEAPNTYGTHDIWVDWPGNGTEDYPNSDPPVGQGDDAHWHPDGTVENLVKIRVHNRGTVEARDVVVRWLLNTPGGAGDSNEFVKQDDSAPQDIPADSFRDFVFTWKPREGLHTCLKAQLLSWDADLGDVDLTNNEAQENVFRFDAPADAGGALLAAAATYPPVVFPFKVGSKLPVPSDVHLDVSGLVPGVDIELERDQLHLGPREEVWIEARITIDANLVPPEFTSNFIKINVHSLLETPDAYQPFGGFTVDLRPRYRSSLAFRESTCTVSAAGIAMLTITGRLLGPLNGAGQPIDAAVVGSDGQSRGATSLTQADGTFSVTVPNLPDGQATAMIYYWGPLMASSTLGPLALNVDCGIRPPRPIPPTLTAGKDVTGALRLRYDASACVASDHAVVIGDLGTFDRAVDAVCSAGSSGEVLLPMPRVDAWFLIGGTGAGAYSSLGQSSLGERRIAGIPAICPALATQDLVPTCP